MTQEFVYPPYKQFLTERPDYLQHFSEVLYQEMLETHERNNVRYVHIMETTQGNPIGIEFKHEGRSSEVGIAHVTRTDQWAFIVPEIPDSSLFRASEGEPYRLTTRRTAAGALSYSCDSLSQLFRKLHLQAGIEGASAMSGRSFASNLLRNGASLDAVQQLLGHSELDHVMPYLEIDPKKLRQMFCDVL